MKNKFCCPSCGYKQPLKKVFLMNNNSHWKCMNCETEIRPERLSSITSLFGFFSIVIPAIISLYIYRNPLFLSMGIGLFSAFIFYLITVFYYFKTTKLVKN
jgi:uncharacterized protein (DUF983 family)